MFIATRDVSHENPPQACRSFHFAVISLESRSVIIWIARVLFPKQKGERKDEKVPAKCRRDRIALF